MNPNILLAGRAEHEAPDLAEEEVADAVAALEEKDPFIERLKPIMEDKKVYNDNPSAWKAKIVGDPQPYSTGEESVTYA